MALTSSEFAGADDFAVSRVLEGHAEVFESLYHSHYPRVMSICRGILLNSSEAEDAAQEAFTLAYKNLKSFDRRASFKTWLYRIAVNHAIQKSRSLKRRSSNVPLEEAYGVPLGSSDHEPDPRVEAALAKLKPDDRAVITLFYWEELSISEIAQALGCRANAIKTRLHRARERFRTQYEEIPA